MWTSYLFSMGPKNLDRMFLAILGIQRTPVFSDATKLWGIVFVAVPSSQKPHQWRITP